MKMKSSWLLLLLCSAFLKIVSATVLCMHFEYLSCMRHEDSSKPDYPRCEDTENFVECIEDAAEQCDMETSPVVEDIIKTHTSKCKEGTEMNRVFKKYKLCINKAMGVSNCMSAVKEEIGEIEIPEGTPEFMSKVHRIVCELSEKGNECINDAINRTCGAEAADFQRKLVYGATTLSSEACKELGFKTSRSQFSQQQDEENSSNHEHQHSEL